MNKEEIEQAEKRLAEQRARVTPEMKRRNRQKFVWTRKDVKALVCKNADTVYYYLVDLKTIAKMEGLKSYIYDKKQKRWITDKEHRFMDRLIGYDGDGIGATSMLELCEAISEDEAKEWLGENEKE